MKKDEEDKKALMRKIDALMGLGRLEEARKTLDKALAISKNDPAFVAMKPKLGQLEKQERLRQNELFKRMTHKE